MELRTCFNISFPPPPQRNNLYINLIKTVVGYSLLFEEEGTETNGGSFHEDK